VTLPGFRGIEHVGITVPDFDAAVRFFVDVLGFSFILDGGTDTDGDLMEHQLGVDRRSTCRWGFVRGRTGPNIELFQYTAPEQASVPPRNSDIGGHHLALYVDDIDAALAHLRSHGVEIMGELQLIPSGPAKGSRWVYFRAPWGLQLELVSYPQGKGDPDSPARRLWHPAYPER
jgi:catechol 2,3-dioxygenase-like lactoylglutathione lyase family enzyme